LEWAAFLGIHRIQDEEKHGTRAENGKCEGFHLSPCIDIASSLAESSRAGLIPLRMISLEGPPRDIPYLGVADINPGGSTALSCLKTGGRIDRGTAKGAARE
jgi:hypothetical protein